MLSDEYARWGGAILESVVDAVVVIDEAGVILDCNSTADAMLGYDHDELVGRNVACIAGGGHAARHDRYIRDYLRTGVQHIMGRTRRLTARRKDGTVLPISLGISEARLDGRRVFTGVLRDATEDVRREEILRRARDELEMQMTINRILQTAGSTWALLDGVLRELARSPKLDVEPEAVAFVFDEASAEEEPSAEGRRALEVARVGADDAPPPASRVAKQRALCLRAAERGELLVVPECRDAAGACHGHYVVPLKADGAMVGALVLRTRPRPPVEDRRLVLLETLGTQIGISLAHMRAEESLRRSRDELRRLALQDGLTGVLNRRAVLRRLREEHERARRGGHGLSVVLLDVDHFKRINDTHGHPAGDAVLREVARRKSASIRPYDAVGRYGGEEFLVVLPGCDGAEALGVAERLRHALASRPMETAESLALAVTASFGVAACTGALTDEQLVAQADAALYRAKGEGRNRVRRAA
jgi:diguanylate cyclase (GGDEF)-like protein/PAS domain S-box-containing protein